jgi:hypothetical protein
MRIDLFCLSAPAPGVDTRRVVLLLLPIKRQFSAPHGASYMLDRGLEMEFLSLLKLVRFFAGDHLSAL